MGAALAIVQPGERQLCPEGEWGILTAIYINILFGLCRCGACGLWPSTTAIAALRSALTASRTGELSPTKDGMSALAC